MTLPVTLPVTLPAGVQAMAGRGASWASWVDQLPALARAVQDEWQLSTDGAALHGYCSLVLPVRTASGRPVMLKLGFPDEESAQEHLALQHWHGRGAVELLRADPHRQALLLERLHPEPLTVLPELEACRIVAEAYPRLHVTPPPQLRRLTDQLRRWSGQLDSLPRGAPVPHRLVEQAAGIARRLANDASTDGVLVHGDLHDANVLAGDREPWLVIDPKPLNGDPHFEPAPMLWNRWDELEASGDVRGAVRRRFHVMVDAAQLDEDRARDWVVLRVVLNAVWAVLETAPGRRPDRTWLTRMITVAKAVQE